MEAVVVDMLLDMPPIKIVDEFMEAMLRLTVMDDLVSRGSTLVVFVAVVGEVGADTMPCRLVTTSSLFCPIFRNFFIHSGCCETCSGLLARAWLFKTTVGRLGVVGGGLCTIEAEEAEVSRTGLVARGAVNIGISGLLAALILPPVAAAAAAAAFLLLNLAIHSGSSMAMAAAESPPDCS